MCVVIIEILFSKLDRSRKNDGESQKTLYRTTHRSIYKVRQILWRKNSMNKVPETITIAGRLLESTVVIERRLNVTKWTLDRFVREGMPKPV
jgi:hypothetical protein